MEDTQPEPTFEGPTGGNLVVISKVELLNSIRSIRNILLEYGGLIETVADSEDWNRKALDVVRAHHVLCGNGASPLSSMDLVIGLFHYLVAHIDQDEFNFRVPARAALIKEEAHEDLAEFSRQMKALQGFTEHLIAQVLALANTPEVRTEPQVHALLVAAAAFFKAVIRQDWEDAGLVITYINLITTSQENHDLVGQIGVIARNIYNSLNEFSEFFTVESLTHSTGEIPDAVAKLRSVIAKLEEAANTNLDSLEKLNGEVAGNMEWATASQETLKQCDQKLAALQDENPGAAEALAKIRSDLEATVTANLEKLRAGGEEVGKTYIALIANQSFQDLTGQTLKKVIAFIETLQFKLVDLLPEPPKQGRGAGEEEPEEKTPYQSQDKVDQLLADLGF